MLLKGEGKRDDSVWLDEEGPPSQKEGKPKKLKKKKKKQITMNREKYRRNKECLHPKRTLYGWGKMW